MSPSPQCSFFLALSLFACANMDLGGEDERGDIIDPDGQRTEEHTYSLSVLPEHDQEISFPAFGDVTISVALTAWTDDAWVDTTFGHLTKNKPNAHEFLNVPETLFVNVENFGTTTIEGTVTVRSPKTPEGAAPECLTRTPGSWCTGELLEQCVEYPEFGYTSYGSYSCETYGSGAFCEEEEGQAGCGCEADTTWCQTIHSWKVIRTCDEGKPKRLFSCRGSRRNDPTAVEMCQDICDVDVTTL